MSEGPWSAEEIALAAKLWDQGLSGSAIGARLKRTRSAVLGLLHRRAKDGRLSLKRTRIPAADRQAQARVHREARHPIPIASRRPIKPLPLLRGGLVDASFARPWLERGPRQCAFPISGEGADTFSCCAPSGDFAYCPAHWKLMHAAPPTPAQRQAAAHARSAKRRAA